MAVKFYNRWLSEKQAGRVLFAFAVAVGLLVSFVVQPLLAPGLGAVAVVDGYDALGRGLLENGALSYYPSEYPTLLRGPVYPLIIAGMMLVAGATWFTLLLVFQSLLHGATALLASRVAIHLGAGRRSALLVGVAVSLHPFLLWYVPRGMMEPVTTFLMTLTFLLTLRFARSGRMADGVWLGALLGVAVLTKATFVVLLAVLALLLAPHLRWPRALMVPLLALLVVAPWTVRNYAVSGEFVPVQLLGGFNMKIGDQVVEHFRIDDPGYSDIDHTQLSDRELSVWSHQRLQAADPETTVAVDREMRRASLQRYRAEPLFFLKKLAVGSIAFWALGSSPAMTVIWLLLQGGVLVLGVAGVVAIYRETGLTGVEMIPAWAGVAYWLAHLPIYAIGRFSVVLVPVLIAYAIIGWERHRS